MTNGRILVGAICAVVVTVALPRHGNAPTGIATLEIVLSARIPTKLLVTLVVAVIVAIANLNPWHTGGVIVALELSLFAREWRTSHFVGAIATVLVAVALPKNRDAAVVSASTAELSLGTICNARLVVRQQDEVVRTSALEALGAGRNKAKVRTSAICLSTWIRIVQLAQWVVDVDVIGTV
uniref:Putative secreted protein n=1 Tax=Ixodes ricinus TaxID=34613 RepID=A0A6B0V022_IXORI